MVEIRDMHCVILFYVTALVCCFGIGMGQFMNNGGLQQNTMTSSTQSGLQHSLQLASFLQNSVQGGNMMVPYWRQQRITGVPNAALLVVLKAVNPDIVAENVSLKQIFCSQCHREGNYVCATMYCGPE